MDAIRAFIAVEVPREILDQLGDLEAQLKRQMPPGSIRWVKPDSIHLTLKFLGQVPSDQLGLITSSLKTAVAAHPAFTLEASGAGCFPNAHRPRVVWAGVHEIGGGHQLAHLQRAVEHAISPLGYPAEPRDFSPHLTLGRLARDVKQHELKQVGDVVAAARVGVLGRWEVTHVALIKSDLQPAGAVYTILARAPLVK
jgi:2'-5' RNA ligase